MAEGSSRAWSNAGATHEFAEFVAATTYDDLPAEVVDTVKGLILDTLAVSVAGADTPPSSLLANVVKTQESAPVATVVGSSFKTDPASAALVNATTGHALDYDDYCFAMSGHPSVILLPPVLALAEAQGLTGQDVIRGYAVGFEAAIMLSYTVNPDHYLHGWHGTGTVGAVGAAAAASSAVGLTFEQTLNAISAGASSGAGLRQNFGTDVKPYHAGNAARSGVMAALLAAQGYVGDHAALEGKFGFFNTFTAGPHRDRERPAFDFAEPWKTLSPGITTKVFPSCGSTHASLGGILELRELGLRAEDVERIDIRLTDVSYGNMQYPDPVSGLEGKFSLQYCVARALVQGSLGLDDFTDEAARDPQLRDLMSKIHMYDDDALNAEYEWGTPRPAVLTVQTASGTTEHRADSPPGSPGNFSRERLVEKVTDCLARGDVQGTAEELVAAVDKLDSCDDLGQLLALVAKAG